MKNRGFTLIELLGVITILALLALLITPVVTNIIKKGKDSMYEQTLNTIKLSVINWATDEENYSLLPTTGNCIVMSLSDLKKENYIDVDIKDPRNDELLSDTMLIKISRVNKVLSYDIDVSAEDTLECTSISE